MILLRDSGVGCKIDNCYTGAISYADDITLSCPGIRGLNRMLDICNKFAAEHYLIFNSKKSLAIKYGKEVNDTEYVLLGQNRINWVDSVKHLGNYFNSQLCFYCVYGQMSEIKNYYHYYYYLTHNYLIVLTV